jgi:toxin HigB-1
MIRSFKHRGLKRLYERDDRSGIRPDLVDTVQEIMTVLDDADTPQELNLPGYRLHSLKGDLKGFWSVTVRANWRIIFRFEGTDAFDVALIDYHQAKRRRHHADEKPRPSRTHREKRLS